MLEDNANTMKDIPEAEARALLADRLVCPDAPDWGNHRQKPEISEMESGLINEDRARSGLHVSLFAHIGRRTQLRTFKFSVFRISLGAPERVYQLHIRQAPRLATNKHDWPHEHIGTARVYGDAGWLRWDYAQALAHFCRQTNISFVPPVNDPEYFELTRS